MDGSSCDFDRARSRPAKTFNGAKKAVYSPNNSELFNELFAALRVAFLSAGRFAVP